MADEQNSQVKKSKKAIIIIAIIAVLIVVALLVKGITAYLTATASATNTFTVGSISIELTEPSWVPENAQNITSNQTIAKDPQVENTGRNDAYVYLKVHVPKAKISQYNSTTSELFTYTIDGNNWKTLEGPGIEEGGIVREEDDYIERVYYYKANDAILEPGEKTPALFNSVKFANITSLPEELQLNEKSIEITAYAIQTNNIEEITNGMTIDEKLKTAYDTYFAQEADEERKIQLSQKIKVGDYVNYDATSGQGAGRSYTVDIEKSGSEEEAETFNSSDITSWRVLSIKNGQIELMAAQPTSKKLKLKGATGYINAETILNEIGDIYGHGEGAISGRSINVEDIDQYFKFEKENYENSQSSTGKYGGTKEYASGKFIVDAQIVNGPQTVMQTFYTYSLSSNKYTVQENKQANTAYSMLCEDIGDNSYWLASTCISLYPGNCGYRIRAIKDGSLSAFHLYYSNENIAESSRQVIPVVTLQTDLYATKGQDGVWNIIN